MQGAQDEGSLMWQIAQDLPMHPARNLPAARQHLLLPWACAHQNAIDVTCMRSTEDANQKAYCDAGRSCTCPSRTLARRCHQSCLHPQLHMQVTHFLR